jgi:PIN domain nuclease of toxin-antitoxin system
MIVLDASALLALLQREEGADLVTQALADPQGALISSVNHAEVVARLSDWGVPLGAIQEALSALPLRVVAFDEALPYRSGQLRPLTRAKGLSLGDRACLALAQRDSLTALTADRSWQALVPDVTLVWVR